MIFTQVKPPESLGGNVTLEDLEAELNRVWDVDVDWTQVKTMSFLEDDPDLVTFRHLSKTLGRHRTAMQRKAKSLGLFVGKVWGVDEAGRRQEMTVTNREGASILEAWYRRQGNV